MSLKHSQGGESTNLLYMSHSQLQDQLLHAGPVIGRGTKPQQARKAAGQAERIHLTREDHMSGAGATVMHTTYVVNCFDIGHVV